MKPLLGFGILASGVIVMYGGITGRLGPMLGALFVPSTLTLKGSGGDRNSNNSGNPLDPGFYLPNPFNPGAQTGLERWAGGLIT